LMAAAMTAMFVGDIGYAWIGTEGHLTGSPLLDLPFLLTYTFFGAAALHPSMAGFASIEARPVQSWSLPRLMPPVDNWCRRAYTPTRRLPMNPMT